VLGRVIKWSVISLFLFSLMTTYLLYLIRTDRTAMYFELDGRGWLYLVVSPLLGEAIHDAYYYWLHRFMHLKPVFRHVHRLHHRSVTPSPWALYAFDPIEAVLTFAIFAPIVVFLPLHPIAMGVLLAHNLVVNLGGHTGHELIPPWWKANKLLGLGNVVTFHDMHHTQVRCNFGSYWHLWDRWMGTVHPDFQSTYTRVATRVP
jgi:sterol desaturase/sphingolipid hydroxylase (fatty acid hydroxylase superfamily)